MTKAAVPPKKPRKKLSFLNFDQLQDMSIAEFQAALRPFKVHVYKDPEEDACEFGLIFSQTKLSEEELARASKRYWAR